MPYLDYAASAPYSPSVKKYIRDEMVNDFANASSIHKLGAEQMAKVNRAREYIAEFIGAGAGQIIFNSGATESINTVLSRDTLEKNGITTIISNEMEHKATLECLKYLEKKGFKVLYSNTLANGELDIEDIESLAKANPGAMLTYLYVNNETGVVNDVQKISKIAKDCGSMFHVDAVQALGRIKFDIYDIDPDFATFSGHKIGALKGIGFLYCNDTKKIEPLLKGGGQERGLRSGTYNTSGIISLSLAMKDIDFEKRTPENILTGVLADEFEVYRREIFQNGRQVLVLKARKCDQVEVLRRLDEKGIQASFGSACASNSKFSLFNVINADDFLYIRATT